MYMDNSDFESYMLYGYGPGPFSLRRGEDKYAYGPDHYRSLGCTHYEGSVFIHSFKTTDCGSGWKILS